MMKVFQQVIVLLVGCFLIALGLNGFLIPQGLMEGGALGISLIVHYVTGTKVGLTFLVISLPIFFVTWLLHRPFFHSGIHGMVFSAVIIDWMAPVREFAILLPIGTLASAIVGGVLIGLGTGLMLRFGTSIGGTDLLAQLLAKILHTNSGFLILLFDIIIVIIGSVAIPSVSLLLSLTTVLCVGGTISLIVLKEDDKRRSKQQKASLGAANLS